MKHFVNVTLVLFFLTLIVSGILRFLLPFSLSTTRVHIIFGLGLIVLVFLHLFSRWKYFVKIIQFNEKPKSKKNHISINKLISIICLWFFFLMASIFDFFPVTQIIELSHESKKRAIIFRPDPKTVYETVDNGFRLKRDTEKDADLLIQVDWGDEYLQWVNKKKMSATSSEPQLAIWAESTTGTLIETFFISEKSAFQDRFEWGGYQQRRLDILPIWRNRFTTTTGIGQDGEETVFFSGATPEHSFSIHNYLEIDSSSFILYLEINMPGDYNEFFNDSKNPGEEGFTKSGIGQPSVLYGVRINTNNKKEWLLLDLIGHGGDSNNETGNIQYDTSRLTTAKKLIDKVLVRVKQVESINEI